MSDTFEVKLTRDDGAEQVFKLEVAKVYAGNPYGYFDARTGDGEPPTGPEIDVSRAVLLEAGVEIEYPLEGFSEEEWERLTEAVVSQEQERQDRACADAEARLAEVEAEEREYQDRADQWDLEYPERAGYDE